MHLGKVKHTWNFTNRNLPIILKLSAQRLFDVCIVPKWNPRDGISPSWYRVKFLTENPTMEGIVNLWVKTEPGKDQILIGDSSSQTRAVVIITPWSILWEESRKNFIHFLAKLVSVYLYAKFVIHIEEPFTYCYDFSADPKNCSL